MALSDILTAISAHADARISDYRKAHQRRISEMREASERNMARIKQMVTIQKEQRRQELLRKSEAHILGMKKNIILRKKQKLLDELFQETLQYLSSVNEEQSRSILKKCLTQIEKEQGVIRPAKGHVKLLGELLPASCTLGDPIDAHGGFVFISPMHEQDFTFDHLLLFTLRPELEVDIAATLFRS